MSFEKTTETTQTGRTTSDTTIGETSERELAIQELLTGLAGQMGSQFGDISNLTAGDVLELPESARQQINQVYTQQAAKSRRQADVDFKDQLFGMQDYLAKRGVQGSSIERGELGKLGAQHQRTLADIESTRAGGVAKSSLEMPFQIAGTQLDATRTLSSAIPGLTNMLLQSFLQRSLAERSTTGTSYGTGTSVESGMTIGDLANLMGSAAQFKKTP